MTDKYEIELIKGSEPYFIYDYNFNSLCRFTYSDTGEYIKIGDLVRWVLVKLENDLELMLVNWKKYES